MSGGEEKTEKPTGKKLSKARASGQVAKTADFGVWLGLGLCVLLVPMSVRIAQSHLVTIMGTLDDVAAHPDPTACYQALAAAGSAIVPAAAPIVLVGMAVGIATSLSQTGFHLATDTIKPKLSKISPAILVTGWKKFFTLGQVWQLGKALVKAAIVSLVLWATIQGLLPQLLTGAVLPVSSLIGIVRQGTASIIRTAVAVGLVLAFVDYAVAKRKTNKDLRMTKTEIKEEQKSSEGNPMIKAAIKGKMRTLARNRMMSAVATADVVLVNPTHVAVALRYEAGRGAPRVVAKGSGHVAARIRERARENNVPMVSDIPLARALYAACTLDAEVPEHLYISVAQVLAFVMALRKRGATGGIHPNPMAA